jgi:hypothetical protein
MANNAEGFKAPQCEKQAGVREHGCPKNSLQQESIRVGLHHSGFPQPSSASAHNKPQCTFPYCRWPYEPCGHELDKVCERVEPFEAAARFGVADGERPSMYRANDAYGHTRSHKQSAGGVTQDLLVTYERCTLVSR